MTLDTVLEELKEEFHSIDIRTFAHKSTGVWNSIFTIIRFRRETVDELRKEHIELIKKCGSLVETENFKVGVFDFPLESWDKIQQDLSRKFLCLTKSFAINFDKEITFNHKVHLPYFKNENYIYDEWKCFLFHNESNTFQKPNYHDLLKNETFENDFSHFDDYLSAIFQYNKYDFQHNPWVNTFIPVFFKIEEISFEHDCVNLTYSAYDQKDIRVALNFYQARDYRTQDKFIDKKSTELKENKNSKLIHDKITMEVNTKDIGNTFDLLVIKNNKVLLENKDGKIEDYWKKRTEFINPIYYAFEQFVKFEELEQMLLQFKSKKLKNDSDVFERGISWLLSLLGIPNIILGEYERLGNGHDQTSTDILASFETDTIFLINVTIGLPQQSDFDKEREYRENIAKRTNNKKIDIHSVYFTGKDATESQVSATANDVTLVGKSNIQMILEHLKKGNLEKARKIILKEDSF